VSLDSVTLHAPAPYKGSYAFRVEGALSVKFSIISHSQVVGRKPGTIRIEDTCTTKPVGDKVSSERVTVVPADVFADVPPTAHFNTVVALVTGCDGYGARLPNALIAKRSKPATQ